jgi:hypothetical protein
MFKEYPKWKYAAGKSVIVEDADAEAELGDGWFNFPDEVTDDVADKAKAASLASDEEAKDLESLRTAAADIGITVDGRWGVQRLEDEIKAKILGDGPDAKEEA